MLKAIHHYIEQQRLVSFKELCLEFDMAPEALEPIIELMLARGDIREAEQSACQELCHDCENPRYFEI
jgi:hypothetical protein